MAESGSQINVKTIFHLYESRSRKAGDSSCSDDTGIRHLARETSPKAYLATTVLDVDLRSGVSSSLPAGVTWLSRLTANKKPCTCDRQGVLKLTFNKAQRKRAEINMTFEYSKGWTFHVGDSATNNGYAGDAGTQKYDAEVHSVDNTIHFYGRDNPSTNGSYGQLFRQSGYVGVQPYTTLTLNVADELAEADNGSHVLYINSYKLFGLRGQHDSTVNYDVYLAMNRVVRYRKDRVGSGLCRVRVRFYPS
ncbi:uncharacterized protein LOC143301565 [Babylonia areolata]|uniref:uncharacterized protein LOC143301565 n=1 Tax=Babylonia areolata TaxID=304850 RepID=UPI003FD07353